MTTPTVPAPAGLLVQGSPHPAPSTSSALRKVDLTLRSRLMGLRHETSATARPACAQISRRRSATYARSVEYDKPVA